MHFSEMDLLILTLLLWRGGLIPLAVIGLVIAGIAYLVWRLIRHHTNKRTDPSKGAHESGAINQSPIEKVKS